MTLNLRDRIKVFAVHVWVQAGVWSEFEQIENELLSISGYASTLALVIQVVLAVVAFFIVKFFMTLLLARVNKHNRQKTLAGVGEKKSDVLFDWFLTIATVIFSVFLTLATIIL